VPRDLACAVGPPCLSVGFACLCRVGSEPVLGVLKPQEANAGFGWWRLCCSIELSAGWAQQGGPGWFLLHQERYLMVQ